MKLSIRLQNHGCANHPYWWIVVAPSRKNIRGRFIEHVGYWAPRHGRLFAQRQIILNIPRIKHWISCGAVPTFKIQKFLSLWNILPKPWYWQRTQQQLASLRKPESEWTEKDKMKEERKRKRRERQKLSPLNYYAPQSKFKALQFFQYHRYRLKLREKINAAEKQNQILRELLIHNQFYKINRINELSGNVVYDDSQELFRLESQLQKAKAQLALVQKTYRNTSAVQKIKIMQHINKLVDKIRQVEKQGSGFRKRSTEIEHEGENISQMQLDKKLEYELVAKKLQAMTKELQSLDNLMDVVTLQQYANFVHSRRSQLTPDEALRVAQIEFIQRGKGGLPPMTKFDVFYSGQLASDDRTIIGRINKKNRGLAKQDVEDYEKRQPASQEIKEHNDILNNVHERNLARFLFAKPEVLVPTNRPVHPFPDVNTYIPEEYYEPISNVDLQRVPYDSLQPKEELQKYRKKREYSTKVKNQAERAPQQQRKRQNKRSDYIV